MLDGTAGGRAPSPPVGSHQERLVDATERERQREHWIEVADAVVAALDG